MGIVADMRSLCNGVGRIEVLAQDGNRKVARG